MDETNAPAAQDARIEVGAIFVAFLLIGLSGFGGVLPFAYHSLVDRRRWLAPAEFTELLGICQLLPGPNIVNLTICFGTRAHGLPGALAGLAGLLLMPVAIVLALAEVYARLSHLPEVAQAFQGIAAAAAGLIVAMAVKMARPVVSAPQPLILAAIVFVAMIVLRVPLVWVIAVMVPVGVAWAWMRGDG